MPNVSELKSKKTLVGAASRIVQLGYNDNAPIKMCIYGRSGTGKTTLWSSFPGPILALVCSGILDPGEAYSVARKDRAKIKLLPCYGYDHVREGVEYAKAGKFKTVVMDHASGLHDLNLKDELGLEELPVQKSWGLATRDQHSAAGVKTKEILREILGFKCNVVILAQERDFSEDQEKSNQYDELDVLPTICASVPPAVAKWLNPSCNFIVRTHIRQKVIETTKSVAGTDITKAEKVKDEFEFCLRTGPDSVYITKFRVPKGTKLPPDIVDPTYKKLMSLITGG